MKRASLLFLTSALICLASGPVFAASPGKKIDSLLEKAIEENAKGAMAAEEAVIAEPEPVIKETPKETVAEAPPPEPVKEPAETPAKKSGLHFAGLHIIPSLALEGRYDSNVYAAPANEQSDFAYAIKPGLRFVLEDSPHEMALDMGYETLRYFDQSSEDQKNYHARFSGLLNGGDFLTFPYDISYAVNHEAREDDLTRELPVDPIQTKTIKGMLGIAYKPGKLGTALSGFYDREWFDDGATAAGAAVIRRDADRSTVKGLARLSYDIGENSTVYLDASHAHREYARAVFQGVSFNGPFRDSDLDEIGGGFKLILQDSLSAGAYAGYLNQNFNHASINDHDMITAHANLDWQVAQGSLLKLNYDRSSYEDDVVMNPIVRSQAGAAFEQTMMDKLLLGIAGSYRNDDFDASTRKDKIAEGRIYADYNFTQRIALGAEYRYSTRDSNTTSFDYDRQTAFLRLSGKI